MIARRGFSLLELLLGVALAAVVLSAGTRMLLALRRFWTAERAVLEADDATRATVGILSAELRGTSPVMGDLMRTSDTAVSLRAARGLFVVCRAPTPGAASILVRQDTALAPREPVAGRESVGVFLLGLTPGRDHWVDAAVTSAGTGTCADASPAWRLTLAAAPGAAASLDSAGVGSPVRAFDAVMYRLYDDGSHTWWLGSRSFASGSWGTTSPLAGPLRARDGLTLHWTDAAGAAVAADSAVRAVRVTARADVAASEWAPGWRAGPHTDSEVVVVAPRNQ